MVRSTNDCNRQVKFDKVGDELARKKFDPKDERKTTDNVRLETN